MKNNIKLLALLPVLFTACATEPLPKDRREFSFVEQTTLKQRDSYNAAISYLAKNLGDSNLAIKVKDQETGTIITQVAIDCPELKFFMDMNRHSPLYNLEISTKDNKVRFVYEVLEDRIYNGLNGALISEKPVGRGDQVDPAKTCAERSKNAILSSMSSKKSDW